MLDNIVCAIEHFKRFFVANPNISLLEAYLLGMKYVYCNSLDHNSMEFQDYISEINKLIKECNNIIENGSITSNSKDVKECPFCGCKQLEFVGPYAEKNGEQIFRLECTHCHASVTHTISYDQIKLLTMDVAKQQLLLKWNARKEV